MDGCGALKLSVLSGGTFDPTLAPIKALPTDGTGADRLFPTLTPAQLGAELQRVAGGQGRNGAGCVGMLNTLSQGGGPSPVIVAAGVALNEDQVCGWGRDGGLGCRNVEQRVPSAGCRALPTDPPHSQPQCCNALRAFHDWDTANVFSFCADEAGCARRWCCCCTAGRLPAAAAPQAPCQHPLLAPACRCDVYTASRTLPPFGAPVPPLPNKVPVGTCLLVHSDLAGQGDMRLSALTSYNSGIWLGD